MALREARIRERFGRIFATLIPDTADGMFAQAIDEFVAIMLAEMSELAGEQGPEAGTA